MKVTYSWLKDFVDIRISPKALADRLTMAGLEVVFLEEKEGDVVFEIEITSNRPDWLSVIGIAREVAAITGKKIKGVTKSPSHQVTSQYHRLKGHKFSIAIEDKQDCPLYTAKVIRDVKVGPSPEWLRKRLESVGCRSINNVVDITNYVLFEYGEPLHAFDLDRLISHQVTKSPSHQVEIKVRRAKAGEGIITIDDVERMLNPDILVIADRDKPVAVAGIMGGKNTEVTEGTKNVLLEAAVFNPVVVRRGRQKLGVQSESSYRFERGVDPEIVNNASWRAVALIQELAGGRCLLSKAAGLTKTKKKNISLDAESPRKILGVDITPGEIKKILSGLGFKLKPRAKNNFQVGVPSRRPDANQAIDLIEEIARIYGYERIPTTVPKISPSVTVFETRDAVSLIKNILAGLGLQEVITYSLIDKDLLKDENLDSPAIEILNPLSKEQGVLRPTVLPGLLKCIALNLNQKQDYINIFEIASVFSQRDDMRAKEELVLGIALCGTKSLLLGQGLIKEEVGLLHLKGILEIVFERLGIIDHKFNSADTASQIGIYIGKEKIGILRQIAMRNLEKFEIKNKKVFVVEVSLQRLFACVDLKRRFTALAVYPGVSRDISLVLKEEIKAEEILETIREKAGFLLEEAKIIDYYKGKQIPRGFKGLTISCLYRSPERTLAEAEINPVHSQVLAALTNKFDAQIR